MKVVREAQAGGKIETGHRVASRISAVFDFAQDTGLIDQHGAAGLTRVLVARKTKKPMASIPPEEAGELMRAIDGYDDSVTRLGLQLLAHTFVRVGELRRMLWGELKENGAVWVVPEARMKMRIPHVVPLSRQAQSILATLREMSGDGALVLDSPIHPGASALRKHLPVRLVPLGPPRPDDCARFPGLGFDGAQRAFGL